jgi:hypothetical protein
VNNSAQENIYILIYFTLLKNRGDNMKLLYVLLVVALLIGGCARVINPTRTLTANEETGDDNGGQTPGSDNSSELQVCTEAINFQVLIDALPTEVNGYVAGEPQGNTLTFQDPTTQNTIQYSTASVTLTKDDKNIDVSATDTCYISFLSGMWLGYYEMEGTDGFLKKATIGGYPGWHQYQKSSDVYSYNIFVEDRVIVTVQGSSGVADSDVEAVANAIGFSAIAAAAK